MTGRVTKWNDATGKGQITGDNGSTYFFRREDCTPGLQATLSGKAILPDPPVRVTFDVDLGDIAINVDSA
jgi:hypothetical protein